MSFNASTSGAWPASGAARGDRDSNIEAETDRSNRIRSLQFKSAIEKGISEESIIDFNLEQLRAVNAGLNPAQVRAIADLGWQHVKAIELGVPYEVYAQASSAKVFEAVEAYLITFAAKYKYAPEVIAELNLDGKVALLLYGASVEEAQKLSKFNPSLLEAIKKRYAAEQRAAFETGVRLCLDLVFAKQLMAVEEGRTPPSLTVKGSALGISRVSNNIAEYIGIGPKFE